MKTDTQIRQDVIAALRWEPALDSDQLQVSVSLGIVRLCGHVGSCAEKWNADHATQRVLGVRGLSSEVRIRLAVTNKRNDADIASAVVNVLRWMSYLPKNSVKVHVEMACITLSGEVRSEFQREAICDTVRLLIGVLDIIDNIAVKPTREADQFTGRVFEYAIEQTDEHADERQLSLALEPHLIATNRSELCGEWRPARH